MRWLLYLIALVPCLLFSQASNPPRNYSQANPYNFPFGPWTLVYPFNQVSGFTVANNDQMQPAALVTDTETFGSTADFTVVGGTNQTFSVSGNVGTISASASSTGTYLVNGTSWPAPDAFVPMAINQVGAAATSDTAGVGLCKNDGSVRILAQYDQVAGKAQIDVYASSTDHPLGAVSITPVAGNSITLGLEGTDAIVWSGSASAGWTRVTTASISSYYNPLTDGNLTNFESCFYIATGASTSTSWQISHLVSGAEGGTNVLGVMKPVTFSDARGWSNGTKVYLTTNFDDGNSSPSVGLIAYDTSTGIAAVVAKYWTDWSGALNYFSNPQINVDPMTGNYNFTYSGWGISGTTQDNVKMYYGTAAKGTLDLLASGVHIISGSGLTQLTPAYTYGWDPTLWCASYNFSTGTCAKWYLLRTAVVATGSSYLPSVDHTTSAPTANSWTADWTGAYSGLNEGGQVLRLRTGSSGVTRFPYFVANVGNSPVGEYYGESSGTFLGNMPAFSGTVNNPSTSAGHIPIIVYGNYAYMFSWNNNTFGPSSRLGELVATRAAVNIPSPYLSQVGYVSDTGGTSGASITSGSISLSGGCYVVACHAYQSGGGMTGITVTSSPSGSWSQFSSHIISTEALVMDLASLSSGSTTFTCTPTVSSQLQSMVVMQATGTSCSGDTTANANNAQTGTTVIISPINTSQSDLGIMCGYNGAAVTWANGFLTNSSFPYLAYNSTTTTGGANLVCQGGSITGALSSLTASQTSYNSLSNYYAIFGGVKFSNPSPSTPTPTYSLASGIYTGTQSVTISDSASGSWICYTTDGSNPMSNGGGGCSHGMLYSGSISVTSTEVLNAVAQADGFNPSYLAAGRYSIIASGSVLSQLANVAQTGSSLVASITSGSVSVTNGETVLVFCRTGGTSGVTSITASSSVSANWSLIQFQAGVSANAYTDVSLSIGSFTASGSTTFKCTPSASTGYQAMAVGQFQGTLGTQAFSAVSSTTTSSSSTYTSPAFSSNGYSANVLCFSIAALVTFTAQNIGGYSSTLGMFSSGSSGSSDVSGCEYSVASAAINTGTGSIQASSSNVGSGVLAGFNF